MADPCLPVFFCHHLRPRPQAPTLPTEWAEVTVPGTARALGPSGTGAREARTYVRGEGAG